MFTFILNGHILIHVHVHSENNNLCSLSYYSAIQNMDSRRAIWNHKLTFKMLEKEWLRTPFKKVTST